jgi:hypothetical protein
MGGVLQDHNMLFVLEKHSFLKRLINCTRMLQKDILKKKEKKETCNVETFYFN